MSLPLREKCEYVLLHYVLSRRYLTCQIPNSVIQSVSINTSGCNKTYTKLLGSGEGKRHGTNTEMCKMNAPKESSPIAIFCNDDV
jgi:hypothetical protein